PAAPARRRLPRRLRPPRPRGAGGRARRRRRRAAPRRPHAQGHGRLLLRGVCHGGGAAAGGDGGGGYSCGGRRDAHRARPGNRTGAGGPGIRLRNRDQGEWHVKLLLADDNHFYRLALESTLKEWGYQVTAVSDGVAALQLLRADDAPKMAILDWMMPRLDGLEVCRQLRALHRPEPTYIIMLTARGGKQNIVAALESGADDFITKPFDREELQARLQVGRRIVQLQTSETVVYAFAR